MSVEPADMRLQGSGEEHAAQLVAVKASYLQPYVCMLPPMKLVAQIMKSTLSGWQANFSGPRPAQPACSGTVPPLRLLQPLVHHTCR